MQACNQITGVVQLHYWTVGYSQPGQKVSASAGLSNCIKLDSVKPCKASYINAGATSGRSLSKNQALLRPLSVQVIGGAVKNGFMDYTISEADPEVHELVGKEEQRQFKSLNLIASENYTSRAVMEAVGSCLTNKYSEGLPGNRYYGGNEHIDRVERICQERALSTFNLDRKNWGVNVQLLSGSIANLAVYTALLSPHDRIMGLELSHGGHLSHGFMTRKRRISAVSKFFEPIHYQLDESTGLIDYEMLEKIANHVNPKAITLGASAYSRDYDYPRARKIADTVGAFLVMDMAHTSGMISASLLANPFDYCDVVTTTTHKSLCGPRGAMIFFKKDTVLGVDLESSINNAVFPGLQGGPHNQSIGGLAVCLKLAQSPEFKAYQRQVISNCKALAGRLMELGYKLVSGGSDNHLLLLDLRSLGTDGARIQTTLDMASITLNKNLLPGDKRARAPGGIRIGTPAMTTRGFMEKEFIEAADLVHRGVQIAVQANSSAEGSTLSDFMNSIESFRGPLADLQSRVEHLTARFPVPGS